MCFCSFALHLALFLYMHIDFILVKSRPLHRIYLIDIFSRMDLFWPNDTTDGRTHTNPFHSDMLLSQFLCAKTPKVKLRKFLAWFSLATVYSCQIFNGLLEHEHQRFMGEALIHPKKIYIYNNRIWWTRRGASGRTWFITVSQVPRHVAVRYWSAYFF